MTDPNLKRDWMVDAACRDHDPELWFPDEKDLDRRELAISICNTCPVIEACRKHRKISSSLHGVWGGRFYKQDTGYVSPGSQPRKPHGTLAAHRRHERAGEEACEACKDVRNEAVRARYNA